MQHTWCYAALEQCLVAMSRLAASRSPSGADACLSSCLSSPESPADRSLVCSGTRVKAATDACMALAWLAAATVLGGMVMLLQPLLLVVLRCVVRTHAFWDTVLRAAW